MPRSGRVPILTWRYRTDASGVRHMGPTAQDFFAAYGLGQDEQHIAPLDANGVTLAAVQQLDRMVQARDARITTLERQNADLRARRDALKDPRTLEREARAIGMVRNRAMIPSVTSMATVTAVPCAAAAAVISRMPGVT